MVLLVALRRCSLPYRYGIEVLAVAADGVIGKDLSGNVGLVSLGGGRSRTGADLFELLLDGGLIRLIVVIGVGGARGRVA